MKDSKTENRILRELIINISSRAAKSVEGVSRVNEIKIDSDNDNDEFVLNAYINVKYGFRIPQVAWDVQTTVSEAVQTVTDRTLKTVNIHIDGVNPV